MGQHGLWRAGINWTQRFSWKVKEAAVHRAAGGILGKRVERSVGMHAYGEPVAAVRTEQLCGEMRHGFLPQVTYSRVP